MPVPARGYSAGMGVQIDRETFEEADYVRFGERLEQCLTALRLLLDRPGFGTGASTIGAELELFLIEHDGHPLPANKAVLASADDEHLTPEIDKFNLEVNPSPSCLAGQPFSVLGGAMRELLERVRRAAAEHGGRVAMVGILPTLREQDLHRGAITDTPRYRVLSEGLLRLRQEPFVIHLTGLDPEPLQLVRDDAVLEGANTSFQVHLRVDPDVFTDAFNAAQLAVAPVLAAAGNSPVFLGRRLWEETRVALVEQTADDRDEAGRGRRVPRVAFGTRWVSHGVLELFEESVRLHEPVIPIVSDQDPVATVRAGGLPDLDELRLHQGTVWRWNRAVYDSGYGGHVRIELRALPAGPTITDMLANAAFLLGLTLGITPQTRRWVRSFPFARAHANFYKAARHGLDAELEWPLGPDDGLQRVGAGELVGHLLPVAREGLGLADVEAGEADRLLDVVAGRVAARQTGAVWQRALLDSFESKRLERERALAEMLERYLELSDSDRPVHTWPTER